MKPLALAGIAIWGILPAWSASQRPAGHSGDAPPAAAKSRGSSAAPRTSTAPPANYAGRAPAAGPPRNSSGRGRAVPTGYYPGYLGYLDYGGENQSDAGVPGVIAPQQPADPPSEARQAAPPPARLEIHEYRVPAGGADTSAVFSIVAKDGSVRSAIAVWVSNDAVHYIDADGVPAQVPLGSVDRESTRRANAASHLRLWLPASSESAREP
jgi:hypothetical protein